MAYREEDNSIVIDGWDSGIASSPYLGIANIRNVNTSYYPGVAYSNYKRQSTTLSSGSFYAGSHSVDVSGNSGWIFTGVGTTTMSNPVAKATSPAGLNYILDDTGAIFKQTAINSSTFGRLASGSGRIGNGAGGLAYWNNYLVVFGDGLIEFCGLGTDDGDVTQANWNVKNMNTAGITTSPSLPDTLLYTGLSSVGTMYINENDLLQFSIAGILPSPLVVDTTYYSLDTVTHGIGESFEISATVGGSAISITAAGSAPYSTEFTVTNLTDRLPIGNCTDLIIDGFDIPGGGLTTNIVSYVNPLGDTVTGVWQGPNGQYNLVDESGNNLLAVLTTGSGVITLLSPAVVWTGGTYLIQILDPDAASYKTWVSKADGNLYFANGRNLGRILSENANISFIPNYPDSYTVDYAATELLQPDDEITDMTDLNSTLIIAGNKDMYTWDYISATTTAPSPVGEQIVSIVNLLNNVYVLAGQKGNIYVTNGYSAQLYYKLSDFIASAIDPVWEWGGLMVHRSKLFFQALAQTTSGTNILAGIFSLIVSPATNEAASGLIMESQNSYGLTPASGALHNGLLIDNSPSSTGYDSYYSAWSNGATTGGIDYNDTTLWSNFEPMIESDIIPTGQILDKRTFGNIEFKLDRPMVTGDAIRLYWRSSLTDSYILIGTTTTTQLSDYYPSNISQSQWSQFKVEMKCASSGSSRVPLREIRLHYN